MLAQSTRSTRFTLSRRGSELGFGVLVKQILLDQDGEFLYVLSSLSLVWAKLPECVASAFKSFWWDISDQKLSTNARTVKMNHGASKSYSWHLFVVAPREATSSYTITAMVTRAVSFSGLCFTSGRHHSLYIVARIHVSVRKPWPIPYVRLSLWRGRARGMYHRFCKRYLICLLIVWSSFLNNINNTMSTLQSG